MSHYLEYNLSRDLSEGRINLDIKDCIRLEKYRIFNLGIKWHETILNYKDSIYLKKKKWKMKLFNWFKLKFNILEEKDRKNRFLTWQDVMILVFELQERGLCDYLSSIEKIKISK